MDRDLHPALQKAGQDSPVAAFNILGDSEDFKIHIFLHD